MPEYDSLKLQNQICFPLYAASKEVVRKYRPYLEPLGLTYTQYIAMLVIWEQGELSVKQLGEKLYLDSGTLTPLLKSLESKGCLARKRSLKDERMLLVASTERGFALRELAKDIPHKVSSQVSLTPEESTQLYRLLYKMLTEKRQ